MVEEKRERKVDDAIEFDEGVDCWYKEEAKVGVSV